MTSRLEVFYDMTRTVQSRGRMAGAVRVESEFASAWLDADAASFAPIAWSSSAGHFVELDHAAALGYLQGDTALPGEVTGPPIEAARPHDEGVRRIIVVTGAGWLSNLTLLHGLLQLRRALRAELQVVVHDLVHLQCPQWAPRDEAFRAASAHEAMLASADRVLVYSESTAADVAAASRTRSITVNDVGRMTLGTSFVAAPPAPGGLVSLLDRPFVLYVSSVATRKNHEFIADVWSRLADELGSALPRLLFVGRAAADQKDALERLCRNPRLEDHLIHIAGSSDAQLAWLYQQCLFTVFPSLYEGWGLPVAESLAFGKVCVASNASSIPEAAGGATPLVDPLDVVGWCNAVRTLILDPTALARAEQRVRDRYKPVTWAEAGARLREAVAAPLEKRASPPVLALGPAPVDPIESAVTRLSWRPARNTLGLVAAHRLRLGLLLGTLPASGIRLAVSLRNDEEEPAHVEVSVNGSVLDGGVIPSGQSMAHTLDVPRDVLILRGLLELVVTARTSHVPRVEPIEIRAEPLSASDEAAAIDARRDAWHLEKSLHFAAGSRHLPLLREGWDQAAPWGVWTTAGRAAIEARPVPPPAGPFELTAIVRAFVPPQRPTLDVDVMLGSTRVATWTFRHPADFGFVERRIRVTPELVVDGWLRLAFVIADARSPQELGMSPDDRQLGIGLVRLHASDPGAI
jgi:glycosyltransferase involved in cell wall biosynthesis